MPDEPAAPGPGKKDDAPEQPASVHWRVDGRLTGMKIAGTVIFAIAVLVLRDDPLGLGLSAVAALALLAYAVRDLIAPVRLAADADGVTLVAGFARRERLGWDQIERVRVDQRRRLGRVEELLEIDAGEALHLFSSYDLGVPPRDAVRTLDALRRS
jgi:hypothetical protein